MGDQVKKLGKSKFGNLPGPGPGRPKGSGKSAFRTHADEAIETLLKILRTARGERTRLEAAKYLLDQAYGKAQQSMEITGAEFVATFAGKIREHDPKLAEQLVALQDEIGAELH